VCERPRSGSEEHNEPGAKQRCPIGPYDDAREPSSAQPHRAFLSASRCAIARLAILVMIAGVIVPAAGRTGIEVRAIRFYRDVEVRSDVPRQTLRAGFCAVRAISDQQLNVMPDYHIAAEQTPFTPPAVHAAIFR
jgi:hypothetical protein